MSARDSLEVFRDLDDLQVVASRWVRRNFPTKDELDAALVAAEEAAEAAAAMTRLVVKGRQGIRQNEGLDEKVQAEFADALIAFADYCTERGWRLADVVATRANEVFARDWAAT